MLSHDLCLNCVVKTALMIPRVCIDGDACSMQSIDVHYQLMVQIKFTQLYTGIESP
jgi:hypothetical protein